LSGVSGVTKKNLSGSGPTYTLPITVTAGGTLSVKVAKSGYTISSSSRSATIYYYSGNKKPEIEGMSWITAGTFTMGSPDTEPGRYTLETRRQVTLTEGFYMSKYQVTQEQYETLMGINPSVGKSNPDAGEIQGKRPVENTTWYDAIEFCNKLSIKEGLTPVYTITGKALDLNGYSIIAATVTPDWSVNGYRLPTEAQWEYACRAGTTTAFNLGSTWHDNWGWIKGNKTHEVGKKLPNAWGLYDMHGNVSEWCWDDYWDEKYNGTTATDPMGEASGLYRVYRGGSMTVTPMYARSAMRSHSTPQTYGGGSIGFRVVRP
jgi:formylglycine-generating enzyme required for sulfatase activity